MDMVKQGYKQTEIGVIPEDWEVYDIQELINNNAIVGHLDGNHGALYPKSHEFVEDGVPYVGANALINGKIDFNKVKYLTIARANTFQKGISFPKDLLFAHNATVGPVAYVHDSIEKLILSTTLTYFRCDESKLNSKFLLYEFQAERFVKQYSSVMSQSTRNQVPITAQRKFKIPLPPLAEQEAIASALSDADALIDSLEQLIAKKQLIKQGAMQKLLTPQDDWEVKKLGEVIEKCTTGKLDANAMVENGEYRFYTCAREYYFINEYAFDDEALLISGNGANVGYIHYYKGKFNAYQRTYVLLGFKINAFFLKVLLDKYLKDRISIEVSAGNTPYIKMDTITEMKIAYPKSLSEQERIATILSDMDAELESLENQLAKARQIKQGMMQELLTGRTRLV
ncbi:restriction endonuclease subunit S [Empedobacter falsenii]